MDDRFEATISFARPSVVGRLEPDDLLRSRRAPRPDFSPRPLPNISNCNLSGRNRLFLYAFSPYLEIIERSSPLSLGHGNRARGEQSEFTAGAIANRYSGSRFNTDGAWVAGVPFHPSFNPYGRAPRQVSERQRDLEGFEVLRRSTRCRRTMRVTTSSCRSAQREFFAADFPRTRSPVDFQ